VQVLPASAVQMAAAGKRRALWGKRRALLSADVVDFGPSGTVFVPNVNITLQFAGSPPAGEVRPSTSL